MQQLRQEREQVASIVAAQMTAARQAYLSATGKPFEAQRVGIRASADQTVAQLQKLGADAWEISQIRAAEALQLKAVNIQQVEAQKQEAEARRQEAEQRRQEQQTIVDELKSGADFQATMVKYGLEGTQLAQMLWNETKGFRDDSNGWFLKTVEALGSMTSALRASLDTETYTPFGDQTFTTGTWAPGMDTTAEQWQSGLYGTAGGLDYFALKDTTPVSELSAPTAAAPSEPIIVRPDRLETLTREVERGGGARGGGNTFDIDFEVNVYVAPGADANRIADESAMEIERRLRRIVNSPRGRRHD